MFACAFFSLSLLLGCLGHGETHRLETPASKIQEERSKGVVVIGSFECSDPRNWVYGFRGPWNTGTKIDDTDLYILESEGSTQPRMFVHVLRPGKYTYERLGHRSFVGIEAVSLRGTHFAVEPGGPVYIGNMKANLNRQETTVDKLGTAMSPGSVVLNTGRAVVQIKDELAGIPDPWLSEYGVSRAEIRTRLIQKPGQ